MMVVEGQSTADCTILVDFVKKSGSDKKRKKTKTKNAISISNRNAIIDFVAFRARPASYKATCKLSTVASNGIYK